MNTAIYLRISSDDEQAGRGVKRQEDDCRAWLKRNNLEDGQVMVKVDNDRSAFQKGVERPAFDEMLAACKRGEVQLILCYRADRLARASREWAKILPLADDLKIRIVGVADGVDTASSGGRMMLGFLAELAREESSRISERVRRKHRELAERGKPSGGGTRGYGHNANMTEVIPAEAVLIQEAAQKILHGVTLYSITYSWQLRGVKTVTGKEWRPQHLHRTLMQARMAGFREYEGKLFPGIPPILDKDTWESVKAHLNGRSKPKGRPPQALLSGTLVCGKCGRGMIVWSTNGQRSYSCPSKLHGGCAGTKIMLNIADKAVQEVVVEIIRASEGLKTAVSRPSLSDRENLVSESARLTGAQKKLAEAFYTRGEISESVYLSTNETIRQRLTEVANELAKASPYRIDIDPKRFYDLPTIERREAIRFFLPRIVVHPGRGADRLEYLPAPSC